MKPAALAIGGVLSIAAMIGFIFVVSASLSTAHEGAERALRGFGFQQIQFTGYRILGCASDDIFRTGFKAVDIQGHEISGTVCSGVSKGYTVRLD